MHAPLASIFATATVLLGGLAAGAALPADAPGSVKRQSDATLNICTLGGTSCQGAPVGATANVKVRSRDFYFGTYGYVTKRATGDKFLVTGCLDALLLDACTSVVVYENGAAVPLTVGIIPFEVSITSS